MKMEEMIAAEENSNVKYYIDAMWTAIKIHSEYDVFWGTRRGRSEGGVHPNIKYKTIKSSLSASLSPGQTRGLNSLLREVAYHFFKGFL